jgi:hypothetical protein
MSLLIYALIVLIIVGLLIYLVDQIPLAASLNVVARVAIILVAIVLICSRAGLL